MAPAKKIAVPPRSESRSGFHYINLYQCCPRKFYLRYVKGWKPIHTPAPLIQGSAFHEGKATWYKKKSEKQAIEMGLAVVESAKNELESSDIYNEIMFRIPHFLHYWIEAFGKRDLVEYEIIGIEKPLVVPLGSSQYVMTMRLDAGLLQKATNLPFIMETKTSGFSHRVTSEAVYYGDQATAYLYGARKVWRSDFYAVIPDIAYWNSRSRDLSNMKMLRTEFVMRDEYALSQFERGMIQLFTEVNQKIEALKKGYSPEILFPRNSYYCLSYSKVCEYAGVCNQDVTKRRSTPPGLKADRAKRSLGDLVDDTIAIQ